MAVIAASVRAAGSSRRVRGLSAATMVVVVGMVWFAVQFVPFLAYVRYGRAPEVERMMHDLPRVVLADAYITMSDDEARRAISSGRIDLRRTVVLDAAPASPPLESTSGGAADAAVVRQDGALRVTIDASVSGARMLVLHDVYYPGWEATLDGEPVPLLRANLAFRAVSVPEGVHIVEFRYRPRGFTYGLVGVALGLILVGLFARRGRRLVDAKIRD